MCVYVCVCVCVCVCDMCMLVWACIICGCGYVYIMRVGGHVSCVCGRGGGAVTGTPSVFVWMFIQVPYL